MYTLVSVGINSDKIICAISEPNDEEQRDSPLYSDLEFLTPTRSFFSARSSDWGRGLDLSSSAMAVLNWEVYDDVRGSNILLFE